MINKWWMIGVLLGTTQCYASALQELKIPKHLEMPAVKAQPKSIKSIPVIKKKKLGRNMEPPKRIIIQAQKLESASKSRQITPHEQVSDTEHIAVVLKNAGFRLYKKRTRLRENSWIYWLKTPTGEPLYKVELLWASAKKDIAEINIWSWDDKTQFDLNQREDLVKVFTKK